MRRRRRARSKKRNQNWQLIFVLAVVAVVVTAVLFWWQQGQQPEKKVPDVRLTSSRKGLTVKLFYYNKLKDQRKSFDPEFVQPVERLIPQTETPVQDTIRLLLQGKLTWQEKASGFETEFPQPGFYLKSAGLKNGVLTLEFPDLPGFTTGGASRITILKAQIIKTAKQFPRVRIVRFKPEYLFQP